MPIFFKILNPSSQPLTNERERLPLWIPVLLGTGIGFYFALYSEPVLWQAALAVIVAGAWIAASWRRVALRLLGVAALVVSIGFLAACLRTHMVAAPVLHKTLYFREVEGSIEDIRVKADSKTILLSAVSIEGVKERTTPAKISISLRKDNPAMQVGDRVRLKAMLFSPPTPAIPGGYDFARSYYYDQLGAVGFSPYVPEIMVAAEKNGFIVWLNALRLSVAEKIRAGMDSENGPVATAMMVGEDAAVSDEVKDAMRDAGIYHVLSISGLHMSLAVGLVYITIRFLLSLYMPLALRLPVKKIAAAVGLLSALAYLLLAGYPVPAVRSFVMVACVMVAVLFDRRGISLYSLAWAASLILLIHPEALLSASFHLSFAATMAILALYERYSALLHASGRGVIRTVFTYLIGIMATSLVATLATSPLVIAHFNRFTLWGILANVLMVPLASFWIMPAAVLVFLCLPFGLEAWPLVALDKGIALMVEGSRWFASLPYANFVLPSPNFFGLLMIVYGGLWLCLWKQNWRVLGIPAMLIGMATIALYKPYDMLISDDASKVMVRLKNGEYLFVRGKPDSFDGEVWLRAAGKDSAFAINDASIPFTGDEHFVCGKDDCQGYVTDRRIAVSKRKGASEIICGDKTDIVITPGWVEGDCAARVLDNRFLEDNGATGIRFDGWKNEIDTAFSYRGRRPWVSLPYSLYLKEKRGMMPAIENRGNDD